MSKQYTPLDIKDTKLQGIIAIHRNRRAKTTSLLNLLAIPFAMMSNHVAYEVTSHGVNSIKKTHSQQCDRGSKAEASTRYFLVKDRYNVKFAFAFPIVIVSLPIQL
jgi:uncharacterized protein YdgA (DUF945 family)